MDEKLIARFWSRVDQGAADDCWPWRKKLNPKGYGLFWDGNTTTTAPRIALILSTGGDRQGLQTRHTCHRPACCNPKHLIWGDGAQNVQDSVQAGRRKHLIGETHNRALLTEVDVRLIRSRHAEGQSLRVLARCFSVARCTICAIVKRRNWKHVA